MSPVLANIALLALDDHFTRSWQQMGTRSQRATRRKHGLGTWRLVRFADDFVVMVNGERRHAEALREEAAAIPAPLGLRLAEEKTRVVHIDEGFDFLGFTSADSGNGEPRSTTSTPTRPGRPSRPSRTRCRRGRTGQPSTWAWTSLSSTQPALAGSPGAASLLRDVA